MKMNKKDLYKFNKKYINANNVKLAILFIPLLILLIKTICFGEFNIKEFINIGILVSFIIVFICESLANLISNNINKYCEDGIKFDENYDNLIKKYSRAKLYSYYDENNKIVKYPIKIIINKKNIDSILNINIDHSHYNNRYELPKQIKDNSEKLMEAHKYSIVYNNINVRIDDFIVNNNTINIIYSKTTYFDSLITNRAMDYSLYDVRTIREIFEPGPFLTPLSCSKLSNHLGFNGFVELSDGNIIFVHRSNNVSIAKSTWAASVSASFKSKYGLDDEQKLTLDGISNAIKNEIYDELKINIEIPDLYKSIIAFYRDIIEGGKPQFLFYLKIDNFDKKSFLDNFKNNISKNKTNKNKDVVVDGFKFEFFTKEDLYKAEYNLDSIKINGKVYRMMPSTIGTVAMLREFCLNNIKKQN